MKFDMFIDIYWVGSNTSLLWFWKNQFNFYITISHSAFSNFLTTGTLPFFNEVKTINVCVWRQRAPKLEHDFS